MSVIGGVDVQVHSNLVWVVYLYLGIFSSWNWNAIPTQCVPVVLSYILSARTVEATHRTKLLSNYRKICFYLPSSIMKISVEDTLQNGLHIFHQIAIDLMRWRLVCPVSNVQHSRAIESRNSLKLSPYRAIINFNTNSNSNSQIKQPIDWLLTVTDWYIITCSVAQQSKQCFKWISKYNTNTSTTLLKHIFPFVSLFHIYFGLFVCAHAHSKWCLFWSL